MATQGQEIKRLETLSENPYFLEGSKLINGGNRLRRPRIKTGTNELVRKAIEREIILSRVMEDIPNIFPNLKPIINCDILLEMLDSYDDQREARFLIKRYSRVSQTQGVFVEDTKTPRLVTFQLPLYTPTIIHMVEYYLVSDSNILHYEEHFLHLELLKKVKIKEGKVSRQALCEAFSLNPLVSTIVQSYCMKEQSCSLVSKIKTSISIMLDRVIKALLSSLLNVGYILLIK